MTGTHNKKEAITVNDMHANHHRLIEERVAKWQALPRRTGIDRIRSREAGKRALWTLRGHLSYPHGQRGLPIKASIKSLTKLHEELHKKEGS